jgi:uncharacterized ParB-like nuclease family protein
VIFYFGQRRKRRRPPLSTLSFLVGRPLHWAVAGCARLEAESRSWIPVRRSEEVAATNRRCTIYHFWAQIARSAWSDSSAWSEAG